MARLGDITSRLYRGQLSYDFVGQRRRWYAISLAFLVLSGVALGLRGLNAGVEFSGGAVFTVTAPGASVQQARTAVSGIAPGDPIVTRAGSGGSASIRVQTTKLTNEQSTAITNALAQKFGGTNNVSAQVIGPSWGRDITSKAILGLGVFLVLVVGYLALTFEPKMAIAAMVALIHDLGITVGIYALSGFEVTPGSVIGFLTILGYSLYDTVVVFDKVRENTRGLQSGSRMTYSQAANLALNQTLVRSINTSVIALLPVASILVVGAGILGAGTLKDLALALFVGTAAGTYSSIFIATPLLAQLREREPVMQALARRVTARATTATSGPLPSQKAPATTPAMVEEAAAPGMLASPSTSAAQRTSRSGGPRQQPRRSSAAKNRPSGKRKR
jgi:preprotein translocase subunit SecF